MRIPRPWLWAGAVAGLVLLLVAIAVSQLLDEASVRREIEARLTALVGRPVHVRGPIDYSLVPTVEFELREIVIDAWPAGHAVGEARDVKPVTALLAVARLTGSVDATSLVSARVDVGDVRLEGVRVALVVDAAGQGNWEGLFPDDPAGSPPAEPTRWALASLAIKNLAIDYRDARDGAHYSLRDAEATLERVELPDPFAFRLAGRAYVGDNERAQFELRARAAVDAERARYGVDDLAIDARWRRESPRVALPVALRATRLDYAAANEGTATLRGLVVESVGVRAKLDLSAESLATAPRASGTIAVEPFEPRAVAKTLEVALPPTADAAAFGRAHIASGVTYGAGRIELHDLQAGLDDTRLTGEVALVLDPREYRFELGADRIVADRYLKPKKLRDASPVQLPLDFLRGLPATGRLRIGELVVERNVLKGVSIDLGEVAQRAAPVAAAR